jgi:hypothetical protein
MRFRPGPDENVEGISLRRGHHQNREKEREKKFRHTKTAEWNEGGERKSKQ